MISFHQFTTDMFLALYYEHSKCIVSLFVYLYEPNCKLLVSYSDFWSFLVLTKLHFLTQTLIFLSFILECLNLEDSYIKFLVRFCKKLFFSLLTTTWLVFLTNFKHFCQTLSIYLYWCSCIIINPLQIIFITLCS